ncbi:MAG TPA: hypothetical protein VFN75_09315 [Pseudonocardiaceae bacterium]|nr:hypothetical protein [Pseudonocardiaceae bacterium]
MSSSRAERGQHRRRPWRGDQRPATETHDCNAGGRALSLLSLFCAKALADTKNRDLRDPQPSVPTLR